QSPLPERQE
ncbi:hypothetical protein PF011_g28011, partial [Phytophthora fragariae]